MKPTLVFPAGIAAGVAIGWLLFTSGDLGRSGEPRRVAPARPRDVRHSEPPSSAAADPTGSPAAVGPILRKGSWREIHALVERKETVATAAQVRICTRRLQEARADGTWRLFRALLQVLGTSSLPEAHAELLKLLNDETLHFADRMGVSFARWLDESPLPSAEIVAAARRRFRMNVKAGETSWVATDGWFKMIARHGDAEDVRWLLERKESLQIRSQALDAVGWVRSPDAAEYVARLARNGKLSDRTLGVLSEHSPGIAFPILRDRIRASMDQGQTPSRSDLQALARSTDEARIAEMRRILEEAATLPGGALAAVYAVQGLDRKGLDVSGLDAILDAPVAYLEALAAGGPVELADRARYAIEYNKITWTERAAAALEAADAALRARGWGSAGEFGAVARKVLTSLKSEWHPRRPSRG